MTTKPNSEPIDHMMIALKLVNLFVRRCAATTDRDVLGIAGAA
jgi:hypothetical protein